MEENYHKDIIESILNKALENGPEDTFKSVYGFGGAYKYFSFGDARASYYLEYGSRVKTYPQAWFDAIEKKRCLVLVDALPLNGLINFASAIFPYALRADLLHGDVLPGIWKGQELELRFFMLADHLMPAPDKESSLSFSDEHINSGDNDASAISQKPCKKYRASGKIKNLSRLTINEIPGADWARFVLETDRGSLDVFCDISSETQSSLSRFATGEFITVVGAIFADAAVGEYENGAVYNVENDLIVLRDAFASLDFARCRSIFSSDCVYIVNDEVRAKGADAILQNFEKVADLVREKGRSYTVKFGALTIEDISKAGDFKRGQKCLLFITPDNQLLNAIFAWPDLTGKIAKLESIYYFKEEMGVYVSDNILDWLHGAHDYDETPEHDD